MKRILDITVSLLGLIVLSPLLIAVAIAIWLQDFHSPFYVPFRMARGGGKFHMVKFRSMVVDADKTGVNSTSGNDRRITTVGRVVRKFKLDEVMQLWNVLKGDMSLVGPRPQAELEARLYTEVEARMLTVRPEITDPASIVFSDEGDILYGSAHPDLLYNQIIRPWKSRLALAYIDHRSFWIDVRLIVLTVATIFSRPTALRGLRSMLRQWDLDPLVLRIVSREEQLLAYPPPGASEIVAEYP